MEAGARDASMDAEAGPAGTTAAPAAAAAAAAGVEAPHRTTSILIVELVRSPRRLPLPPPTLPSHSQHSIPE